MNDETLRNELVQELRRAAVDAVDGAELSDDTLCAYLEGTLPEAAEDQMREAATADPALAARLVDLAALLEAAPPRDGADQRAVTADFDDFRERLERAEGPTAGSPPIAGAAGPSGRVLVSWIAAASLVLAVGAALLRAPGNGGEMLVANVRPPEEQGVVRGEDTAQFGTRGPGPVLQLVHDDPGEATVGAAGADWLYVEALAQARGEVCSGELLQEGAEGRSLAELRLMAGKVYFALRPEVGSYRVELRCDGAVAPFSYRFRVVGD
ncbi:MAG: hypothetical protein AAF604_02875 [Acidobacteriota bacterium]